MPKKQKSNKYCSFVFSYIFFCTSVLSCGVWKSSMLYAGQSTRGVQEDAKAKIIAANNNLNLIFKQFM
jgi:hypothetical protein